MVHKVLSSAAAVCVGYTLMTLMVVNGTKANIDDKLNSILTTIDIMKGTITKLSEVVHSTNEIVSRCNVTDGFFFAPNTGNSQCLKLFLDLRLPWNDASDKCKKEGLVLARPYSPIQLRRYLMDRYGLDDDTWLGARGDGNNQVWQTDRPGQIWQSQVLDNYIPLWYEIPNTDKTDDYCLFLLTIYPALTDKPDQPYSSKSCKHNTYPLCEKLLEPSP